MADGVGTLTTAHGNAEQVDHFGCLRANQVGTEDGPAALFHQHTLLTIDGMHCDGCVQTVQHLLEQQAGVKGCSVSMQAGRSITIQGVELRADR